MIREITQRTSALHEAATAAIQAHYIVCSLGCSDAHIACAVHQRLALAEDAAWWAAKSETLPPSAPVYTERPISRGQRQRTADD